ncbi:MAG TPA: outer membrane beta-barrel protein [Stellaceae bacterium]|nr:outer membrane beta-barrel protein [Stellaceae bacterium]
MRKLLGAATLLALAVGASPSMAQVGSGVYFRIDAGGGFSANTALADTDPFNPSSSLGATTYSGDAGRSVLGSAGIGVRLSPIFRIDLTGSYMPWLRFSGQDNIGGTTVANAKIKPRVGLVNGYVDLGGLAGFPLSSAQPYLVGSVGASRNQLDTINFSTPGGPTFATINGRTTTEFAWGVGAGIGIPLGRFVTFDLMYKYLDLGRVESSNLLTTGGTTMQATAIAADLHVHTVTAGLRFGF